jgi:hypothetical protein
LKFHHTARHGLGVSAARAMLDEAFAHYTARHPHVHVARDWQDEREGRVELRARGVQVRCNVRLDDADVSVEADLPLLLRPFVGRIRDRLDREVQVWLQRAATPA